MGKQFVHHKHQRSLLEDKLAPGKVLSRFSVQSIESSSCVDSLIDVLGGNEFRRTDEIELEIIQGTARVAINYLLSFMTLSPTAGFGETTSYLLR